MRRLWSVFEADVGIVVLSEIEACSFRNKSPEETAEYMKSILDKYMPLRSGTSKSQNLQDERKKDHYSHFILRLAFSSTEDLRRRFARLETMLFRLRFKADDVRERQDFVRSLDLQWEEVKDDEKRELRDELLAAAGVSKKSDDQEWFKVDWERVPELVEQRRVLLKRGKAYVPQREQMSLVVAEFTKKLDEALEVCRIRLLAERLLTRPEVDLPRPAPPRRRRPSSSYSWTSLAIVHRARCRILILRRQHRRPLGHNREQHRYTFSALPALHAQPTHNTARELTS